MIHLNFFQQYVHVCMHAKWLQLFLTLCDSIDSSLLNFSVQEILQVKILEWVKLTRLVVMYGCESWTMKTSEHRCFWTVVLEKTLESPLDCKEIQLVHPKGDQSWVFIGRTDAKAETPILWPPDAKSWLVGKDPDAGKDWGQEEEGQQRMR